MQQRLQVLAQKRELCAFGHAADNIGDFWKCAGTPHHEEMAVDTAQGENKLFDAARYAKQFELRQAAAVAHVRQEFVRGWQL